MERNNLLKDISIVEKTDEFTFEEVYQVIYNAHEENRKNGIMVNTKITNGKELEEHLGKNAVCYIALDGNKIVGTASVVIESGVNWSTRNLKIARWMYFAILPEYAGRKIGSLLYEKVEQYALENKADAVVLFVVERNPARHMYVHKGFEALDYIYRAHLRQNSVYMVKWLKKCKYPAWFRQCYYVLKKSYIRIRYKGK